MDKGIKNLEEMTDSRLMFEKKVPAFGYMLISIVAIIIISLIIWSIKAPKTSVIKSGGIIQSKEKNYIMVPYSGEIKSFNIKEGDLVKEGDVLFTLKSTELDMQEKQLADQKVILEEQLAMYRKLELSVKENKNHFSPTIENEQLYYNMFEAYVREVSQISDEVNVDMLKMYGYTQEQINEEIKKNDKKVEQRHFTELQNIQSKISEINTQLTTANTQIESIDIGQEEYSVKANTSGKVHLMGECNVGMVMQAGTSIASISSDSDEFEVYVSVSDLDAVRIEEGDIVDIAVSGLNQSVYGTISGKVVSKDSDITIQNTEKGAATSFNIKVEPDYNYLVNKNGDKYNLSNGMTVEARIKYDKITYFDYALEAIGLKF